jgi:hypothetical protein
VAEADAVAKDADNPEENVLFRPTLHMKLVMN